MNVSRLAVLFLFGVLIQSLWSSRGLAQYGDAVKIGYNHVTGDLHITFFDYNIGVVGIEGPGITDLTKTPLLGSTPAAQFDANVLAFFNPQGLTPGEFLVAGLKRNLLPRPYPNVEAGYTPIGKGSLIVIVPYLNIIPSEPSGPAIIAPAAVAALTAFRRQRAKVGAGD